MNTSWNDMYAIASSKHKGIASSQFWEDLLQDSVVYYLEHDKPSFLTNEQYFVSIVNFQVKQLFSSRGAIAKTKRYTAMPEEDNIEQPSKSFMQKALAALPKALKGKPEDVRQIIALLLKGFTQKDVAAMYGVSPQRIHQKLSEVL